MKKPLHTVVETPSYRADFEAAGLTQADRDAILDHMMAHPDDGTLIKGSAGVRKVRIAGRGFGKSGGFRLITGLPDLQRPSFSLLSMARVKKQI